MNTNSFKTKVAYNEFMHEAMTLESNLSRALNHNKIETLYLYADDTGHIITWYREKDPAGFFLDAQHGNFYHKIPWQVRGTA